MTVQSAVKYQGEGTEKRIRLVIANAAAGGAEFEQLIEFEDELWKSLQPDVIHNVYVSLLNDDDAIIGLPYEVKVDELHPSVRYPGPENGNRSSAPGQPMLLSILCLWEE